MIVLAILLVGAVVGFLGGLFGKGGSALATPVLAALGVPPILAVAGPLPATIPGTLLAAREYARRGHIDRGVARWCVAVGLPATIVGALLTRWIPAENLVTATDVVIGALGIGILVGAGRSRRSNGRGRDEGGRGAQALVDAGVADGSVEVDRGPAEEGGCGRDRRWIDGSRRGPSEPLGPPIEMAGSVVPTRGGPADALVAATEGKVAEAGVLGRRGQVPRSAWSAVGSRPGPVLVAVAAVVGLTAGLLANSGGFLLAPLFLVVLRMPVRSALGTSLVVSAALAVPGAVTHAALGHLDLGFVALFAVASVPFSALGARTALRIDAGRLEVAFGAVLVVLAACFLVWA